jgi:rsbT co-antagonist protein RsbR
MVVFSNPSEGLTETRVVVARDAAWQSETLVKLLQERDRELIEAWVGIVSGALGRRVSRGELERELGELFVAVLEVLSSEVGDRSEIRRLLTEMSGSLARQGLSPTDTAVSVFSLKTAVLTLIESEPDNTGLYRDFSHFSQLIDELGLVTFDAYVAVREEVIHAQAEQLLELSTPVVKLWDGVVAVPLVGTLDSARTQVVMENLLQALVDTGSEHAIIDITGVPAVDTQVAQHLLRTVMAARLMGAECIVSGIRPQIAQTIVALGIEFGDIATKATLADALAAVMRQKGIEVVAGGSA